jgi:hypothetical protein
VWVLDCVDLKAVLCQLNKVRWFGKKLFFCESKVSLAEIVVHLKHEQKFDDTEV